MAQDYFVALPQVRTKVRYRCPKGVPALTVRLDAVDWKLLDELQRDGRMTNVELSRRVGISAPPCLRRVRALEEAGIIEGYRALLDARKLGLSLMALSASILLVGGQWLFERQLGQAATLSVVVEFAGGLFFLYLLLKGRIR